MSSEENVEKNKKVILKVLEDMGVKQVKVEYDGSGDSGQIEDVTLIRRTSIEAMGEAIEDNDVVEEGEDEVMVVIEKETNRFNGEGWDRKVEEVTESIEEAVKELCYDLLEGLHAGWEINEGSNGEFMFEVGEGVIHLTHHNNYMETDTTSHEL
jgi:hypothetical protein